MSQEAVVDRHNENIDEMDYHNAPTRREMALSPLPRPLETPHKSRRLSVIDKFSETEAYMRSRFQVLTSLWDEIEMSEESRVQRARTAFEHVHNLIDDMVESEQQMVQEVKADIKSGLDKVKQLRDEMDMEEFTYSQNYPSLALLRHVEKELKLIQAEHDERKRYQNELIEKAAQLSLRIGKDIQELVPEKRLMKPVEVDTLKAEMIHLQEVFEERLQTAAPMQADIRNWVERLGNLFNENESADVKVILMTDVQSEEFVLSESSLGTIKQYHNQISEIYQQWLQDQDFLWTSKYTVLEELWSKCMVGIAERAFLPIFDPLYHTSKDLERMELEQARLEKLYTSRKRIYDYVSEFQEVWDQKIALSSKMREAGYYQSRDRSHNILKDAQLERQLEHSITVLEKQIVKSYNEYIAKHPDDSFRINSVSPPDFVKKTREDYFAALEEDRQKKALMRQTSSSTLSSPRTPQKKPFARTPASCGKMEPPHKKPMLDRAFTPRTGRMPSLIQPVNKTSERGPKTSSPRQAGTPGRTPLKRHN